MTGDKAVALINEWVNYSATSYRVVHEGEKT